MKSNNQTIRQTSLRKTIVVPIVIFGVIAVAALGSAHLVNAQQPDFSRETLVDKIVSRFGLNETEVRETLDEFRFMHSGERHERMGEMLEDRLEQAVENGNLTSEQMHAVLAKHEELEGKFDDLFNLSPEDRREARADIHDEMELWAQENGIDMDKIVRFERSLHNRGGRFMHK